MPAICQEDVVFATGGLDFQAPSRLSHACNYRDRATTGSRRALRPDAEVAVSGHVEPLLLHGGRVVKSLSVGFLADFEQHWRTHGRKVLDILAEKYPQAYFGGAVALAKSIKWETGEEDLSDGGMTPDEIMDKLEQRVGPQGRKLFEDFLRKVNKLQAQQQLEAQARTVENRGGDRGR